MLLSDRDLRAEISAGRLGIDPFDDTLVQPSSVDVRLDRMFRVFNNTRYTHIDPARQQDELTSLVEPADGEPFVLHPGEFVLGSTLELVALADDLAAVIEHFDPHRPFPRLQGSRAVPDPPRRRACSPDGAGGADNATAPADAGQP